MERSASLWYRQGVSLNLLMDRNVIILNLCVHVVAIRNA